MFENANPLANVNPMGAATPMMNMGPMGTNSPLAPQPQYGMYNAYNPAMNSQVNGETIKINPQVLALVNPIIETMTQSEMFDKKNAAFGMWDPKNSLSDYDRKRFEEAKKNCVHLIRDVNSGTGNLIPTLEEFDETRFKCRVCGRTIYKKFDKSAIDILENAISVLNMLAFFGMTLNITAEHMSKIVFLKQIIPDAIQLVDILNKFVNEENNSINSGANIGEASRNAEFRAGTMLGFGF